MSSASAPAASLSVSLPGLSAEAILGAIKDGAREAMQDAMRAEFRQFLEDYFGCLDKSEAAAFLGVSERTIEQLWQDQKIPKDTALGDRMPRTWLPELKRLLAASRIKARDGGRLRVLPKAAA